MRASWASKGGENPRVVLGRPDFCLVCGGAGVTSAFLIDGPNRQRAPIASVQRTESPFASHSAVPRGTNAT